MYTYRMEVNGYDILMVREGPNSTKTVKVSDKALEQLEKKSNHFVTLGLLLSSPSFNPRAFGIDFPTEKRRNLPEWW